MGENNLNPLKLLRNTAEVNYDVLNEQTIEGRR